MSELTEFIRALAVLGVVGLLIALAVYFMRHATPDDLQDTLDDIDDATQDRIENAGADVSDDAADAADQRVRGTAADLGVDTGDGVGAPDTTVDDIIRDIDFDEDVQ